VSRHVLNIIILFLVIKKNVRITLGKILSIFSFYLLYRKLYMVMNISSFLTDVLFERSNYEIIRMLEVVLSMRRLWRRLSGMIFYYLFLYLLILWGENNLNNQINGNAVRSYVPLNLIIITC
jgi:hypothetical protein